MLHMHVEISKSQPLRFTYDMILNGFTFIFQEYIKVNYNILSHFIPLNKKHGEG